MNCGTWNEARCRTRAGWLLLAAVLTFEALSQGHAASISAEDRARIEQAVPRTAMVKPVKPRRLLIFTRNVGYGGHPSMVHASEAFGVMGRVTGAFETVVSEDPAMFERDSLKGFDAVFFNNTVGNCFTNATLRRNLLEFVTGGGGLMGVHGTSVAFTQWPGAAEDWPEFGYMIGGRGANHRASDEHIWMKLDDASNPINGVFGGQPFDYRDEFFRVHDPYSRRRVRVLFSMDTNRTDAATGPNLGNCHRADGDYAFAWIRSYGRGRTFYCTIAHNPYVFWDPKMLSFYLGAIQFALGDLQVLTTPSAWLTPAVRAQENLGWRLGVEAYTFHKFTFFEAVDKTAQLGLPFIGGLSFQKVGGDIDQNFEPGLTDVQLDKIRAKLNDAGLRLLTYYIQDIPADEAVCRKLFEFGRKMGIETFISEPKPEAIPFIEKFCEEYGINLALHNHDQKASPHYWSPEKILEVCQGRGPRIGAGADVGYWMRGGIDPVAGIEKLGSRLITLQMHDLHAAGTDGHDVPWGTGVGNAEKLLAALKRSGARPTMIGLEYSYNFLESLPEIAQTIEFYNRTVLNLTK